MIKLSPEMLDLLREIFVRHCPDRMIEISNKNVLSVSPHEVDILCQILTDEFVATGLRPDSEPNARGLLIEQLIDKIRATRRAGVQAGTRKS